MWTFYSVFLIVVSVFVLPVNGLEDIWWLPKEAVYNVLAIGFIGYSFISPVPVRRKFSNLWIGLGIMYCGLSFGWFFYKPLIFEVAGEITWNLWTIRPTINILLGIIVMRTLIENTDTLGRWVKVAKTLCWTAFALAVYGLFQRAGIDQLFRHINEHNSLIGLLGQGTLTGMYLSCISPLCLMFRDKKYLFLYIVIAAAVIASESAIAVGSLFLGLIVYFIMSKNPKNTYIKDLSFVTGICVLIYVVLAFIIVSMVAPHLIDSGGRVSIWNNVYHYWLNRPFFGFGIGRFADKVGIQILNAHSEPLQIAFDGGVFLLTIVMGYIITLGLRMLILSPKKKMNLIDQRFYPIWVTYTSAFVAFCACSAVNFPLRIAPLALLGMTIIAGLETLYLEGA